MGIWPEEWTKREKAPKNREKMKFQNGADIAFLVYYLLSHHYLF